MTNTVQRRVPVHHQKSLRNESCGSCPPPVLPGAPQTALYCTVRCCRCEEASTKPRGGSKISDNYGGIFFSTDYDSAPTKSGTFREGLDSGGATCSPLAPLCRHPVEIAGSLFARRRNVTWGRIQERWRKCLICCVAAGPVITRNCCAK